MKGDRPGGGREGRGGDVGVREVVFKVVSVSLKAAVRLLTTSLNERWMKRSRDTLRFETSSSCDFLRELLRPSTIFWSTVIEEEQESLLSALSSMRVFNGWARVAWMALCISSLSWSGVRAVKPTNLLLLLPSQESCPST